MNSIDNSSPSPFICPFLRTQNRHQFQKKKINKTNNLIIDNSYHISDNEDDKFSPSHNLYLFHVSNNKDGEQNDIFCAACWSSNIGKAYYFCNVCDKWYHKECVESPPMVISPFHPKYPLQLLKLYSGSVEGECHSCGLIPQGLFYYSSNCDLVLDPVCARKQEFLAIKNPKRHDHILHYFSRKASLTCDVCALDDRKYCFYTCLQCDFIVHRTCIDMPRVILLSCHNHRVSFNYSLPFGDWSCGVCRGKIDENYGSYSCTKGCIYAVHSKCATLDDVWDGEELEDQLEMTYDDIKSFEEIGDGVIRHFSHPHHQMRLIEDVDKSCYVHKQCQACILPLYDGGVYRCMQCDFTFHEECANLPRVKQYVMHPHRLVLTTPIGTRDVFRCSSCDQYACGFRYVCSERCITSGSFNLDVRCATLSERVDHQSHPHPLFLIYKGRNFQRCSTCGRISYKTFTCVECDFDLCFQCATLPYKVKHKVDEHMLTLLYERNASCMYWCEVCEETTNPKRGYYACNECGVTFHIKCILGNDPYMKASIIFSKPIIDILPNNGLNRPICNHCQKRCQYNIIFKTSQGHIFCSFSEAIYENNRYY